MSSIYAFVDEYGNTDLDVTKRGATRLFVVTAVLVAADSLERVRKEAETIRSTFFGAGEMKSKNVGSNDERRKKILGALTDLDIKTYSLAIDKAKIVPESGLRQKRSFVKYINRRLYERAFRIYEDLNLTADEHGSQNFMEGFVRYLERKLPRTLFNRPQFAFAPSDGEVLLQVADMVAGSLARSIDPNGRSPAAEDFLAMIAKNEVAFDLWPPHATPGPEAFLENSGDGRHDEVVRRHCVRQASLFLQQNAASDDEDTKIQVDILQMLMAQLQFRRDEKYVPTGQIIDRLRAETGTALTSRRLRAAISRMRDLGVIVANSSKGYKIPVSERDVAHFVSHTNSIVPAMLSRLRRARDDLRAASLGALDILDGKGLETLASLVDVSGKGGAA